MFVKERGKLLPPLPNEEGVVVVVDQRPDDGLLRDEVEHEGGLLLEIAREDQMLKSGPGRRAFRTGRTRKREASFFAGVRSDHRHVVLGEGDLSIAGLDDDFVAPDGADPALPADKASDLHVDGDVSSHEGVEPVRLDFVADDRFSCCQHGRDDTRSDQTWQGEWQGEWRVAERDDGN